MEVDNEELPSAASSGSRPGCPLARGYTRLYIDHLLQANRGVDLGFLVGASGHQPPRHNH
jgi:L-arabonate dehydrase